MTHLQSEVCEGTEGVIEESVEVTAVIALIDQFSEFWEFTEGAQSFVIVEHTTMFISNCVNFCDKTTIFHQVNNKLLKFLECHVVYFLRIVSGLLGCVW